MSVRVRVHKVKCWALVYRNGREILESGDSGYNVYADRGMAVELAEIYGCSVVRVEISIRENICTKDKNR